MADENEQMSLYREVMMRGATVRDTANPDTHIGASEMRSAKVQRRDHSSLATSDGNISEHSDFPEVAQSREGIE
jgi:hypothetical protein